MSIASHLNSSMKKHHAANKKETPKKKSVSHFHVEPAKGGFVVKTHMKEIGHEYREPEPSIHKNLSSVKKHMEDCCGDGDSGGDEKEGM